MLIGPIFRKNEAGEFLVDKDGDFIVDYEASAKHMKEIASQDEANLSERVEKELREAEKVMTNK